MEDNFYLNNTSRVDIKKLPFSLNSDSKSFFMGSCFSDNLNKKFKSLFLNTTSSPFGNIYNPLSLANSLNILLNNKKYTEKDLINIDGLYHSFDFYSKFGEFTSKDYLNKINNLISESSKALINTDLLILTLGTAFIYEKNNIVVNNCHKLSKSSFNRRVSEIDEIETALIPVIYKLKKLNKNINIVLTLSPVRHLRDSASENSYSKAILRVAIENIIRECNICYFPSYEILLDELRDYRWYKDDLCHPTERAIEYITNSFINSCKSDELNNYLKRAEKIKNNLNHIIINPNSDSSKKFIDKRESQKKQFRIDYPYIEI